MLRSKFELANLLKNRFKNNNITFLNEYFSTHHYNSPLFYTLIFMLLNWAYMGLLNLGVDEAHYMLYARNLDLSYFDHPPLIGWTHAFFNFFFGENLFSARLPAFISSAWLLYEVINWFKTDSAFFDSTNNPNYLNKGFLIFATYSLALIPFGLSLFFLPDTLLIPISFRIAHYTIKLSYQNSQGNKANNGTHGNPSMQAIQDNQGVKSHQGGQSNRGVQGNPSYQNISNWILLGLWLGLAGLTKYSAVLFLPAVIYLILNKYKFMLFRQKGFYFLIITSLVTISPVLIWNWQNNWVSFQYQFNHVIGQTGQFENVLKSYLMQWLGFGPLITVLFFKIGANRVVDISKNLFLHLKQNNNKKSNSTNISNIQNTKIENTNIENYNIKNTNIIKASTPKAPLKKQWIIITATVWFLFFLKSSFTEPVLPHWVSLFYLYIIILLFDNANFDGNFKWLKKQKITLLYESKKTTLHTNLDNNKNPTDPIIEVKPDNADHLKSILKSILKPNLKPIHIQNIIHIVFYFALLISIKTEIIFKSNINLEVFGWPKLLSLIEQDMLKHDKQNNSRSLQNPSLVLTNWTYASRAIYYSSDNLKDNIWILDERFDQFDLWQTKPFPHHYYLFIFKGDKPPRNHLISDSFDADTVASNLTPDLQPAPSLNKASLVKCKKINQYSKNIELKTFIEGEILFCQAIWSTKN